LFDADHKPAAVAPADAADAAGDHHSYREVVVVLVFVALAVNHAIEHLVAVVEFAYSSLAVVTTEEGHH